MGYSVLYVAFGIVALWLLGEVLLQYKARLRWRLLALGGFMGVVGGVALREAVVILLGAVAFGTGQTFVTLSYKRGFSTGWALGGRPGSSRRRRGAVPRNTGPTLEVTPVEAEYTAEYTGAAPRADEEGPADQDVFQPVYQPLPMPEDSDEYPLYDGQSSYTPDPYTSGGSEGYGAQGYAGWDGENQPAAATASYEGGYEGGYDEGGYWQQSGGGWGGPGYGYGQEQPAAASYDTGGGYDGYDGYGAQVTGGTGDWTPQPHPKHSEPYPGSYRDPQTGPDPYAGGYGYDPQAQPYIPQQPHESPYEQHPAQPRHTAEQAEYADPHDPYRH
ncbi:hypothetical protein [Streptomyces sp.]|uniref:hypothetical protein n=1 Tax=Streptomyces sp. TaxID=1931 RepID=UPI002F3E3DB8